MADRRRPAREHRKAIGLLAAAACALALPGVCRAESLYDAFDAAVAANPALVAERAAVRVVLQDKALAATGYAPSIVASGDDGYRDEKGRAPLNPTTELISHPRGYGASLSQNLFDGFKTTNSVAREDAALAAERDQLRDAELNVLVDVATAYADVVRDRSILALRRADQDLLGARARETRARYATGDRTLTDVDQSLANLARSDADMAVARSTLEASTATFRAAVGRDPGRLDAAGIADRLVPRDLPTAMALAAADHPAIRAALATARAAEINVDVEKAGYAPSLDLTASAEHRYDPDFYPARTDLTRVSVIGRLSVPIFDRGVTTASVQRAREVASQRMADLDRRRASIRASVVQSWGLFAAAKTVIASAEAQIAASDRALTGVEIEAGAGGRTTLDILTAQRSLLDARVNREIALHDRVVAGYKLLASIGRLSLSGLTPGDTRGVAAAKPGRAPVRTLPGLGLRPAADPPVVGSVGGSLLRPALSPDRSVAEALGGGHEGADGIELRREPAEPGRRHVDIHRLDAAAPAVGLVPEAAALRILAE